MGAAPGSHTDIDWFDTWRNSQEYSNIQEHLTKSKFESSQHATLAHTVSGKKQTDKAYYHEFAAPFGEQLREPQIRVSANMALADLHLL